MFTMANADENTKRLQKKYLELNPDMGTVLDDLQISRMELKRVLTMNDPDPENVDRLWTYLADLEAGEKTKIRGLSA